MSSYTSMLWTDVVKLVPISADISILLQNNALQNNNQFIKYLFD